MSHIHHGIGFRFNHRRVLDYFLFVLGRQRAMGEGDGGKAKPVVSAGSSASSKLGLVDADL